MKKVTFEVQLDDAKRHKKYKAKVTLDLNQE